MSLKSFSKIVISFVAGAAVLGLTACASQSHNPYNAYQHDPGYGNPAYASNQDIQPRFAYGTSGTQNLQQKRSKTRPQTAPQYQYYGGQQYQPVPQYYGGQYQPQYQPVPQYYGGQQYQSPAPQYDVGRSQAAGGLVGVIVGSRFGKGEGRAASMIAGGIAGSAVGGSIADPCAEQINGGTIVGAGAGALLGHSVGKGQGKTAAEVALGLLGAKIGTDISNSTYGNNQPRSNCPR